MSRLLAFGLCALITALSFTDIVAAGDCIDYRDYMGWASPVAIPSRALDILISQGSQDKAYLAMEWGLAELSLTDPAEPVLVDTLDCTGRQFGIRAASMALHAGTLWVAAGEAGLFQIATDSLRLIDRIDTPGEPWDIAIRGDLAVVADWDQGLTLYDVSTATPVWQGSRDLPGFATGVAAVGDRAYVVDLVSLTVLDISDPETPAILGSITLPGQSWDLAIRGQLAYVAGSSGVQTVDIADPQHLALVDTQASSPGRRVCLGEDAVMVCGEHWLGVLDLNDPRHPQPFLDVRLEGDAVGMATLDERLFVGGSPIRVLDLHQGVAAPSIGRFRDPRLSTQDLAVDGNFAYLAGYPGLSIIDISTRSAPVPRGLVAIPNIKLIAAAGGFAYVLAYNGSCVTVDCSNPDLPAVLGQIATTQDPTDWAIASERLYVLNEAEGLQILDLSTPSTPVIRGTLDVPGSMAAISALSSRLYIAGSDASRHPRLLIADASDPDAPQVTGAYEFAGEGYSWSVAASDTRAYVLISSFFSSSRLAIIDVSTPALPVLLGEVDTYFTSTWPKALTVTGTTAYIAGEQGVLVVDVSDPASPRIIGTQFDLQSGSVATSSDCLLGLAGNELVIVPLQCSPPSPVELASFEAAPIPGAIQLTWRTSREWDHLGFHVERALAAGGAYERLSERIPPPGPYAYLDRAVAPGVTYFYRLAAIDRGGRTDLYGPISAVAGPAASNVPPPKPTTYALAQSHPNPFLVGDRETAIPYALAAPGRAKLRIFDATGRLVATLVDTDLPAGEHLATWNGRTVRGESAPAGTYFYRLEAGTYTATQQLVRLR